MVDWLGMVLNVVGLSMDSSLHIELGMQELLSTAVRSHMSIIKMLLNFFIRHVIAVMHGLALFKVIIMVIWMTTLVVMDIIIVMMDWLMHIVHVVVVQIIVMISWSNCLKHIV